MLPLEQAGRCSGDVLLTPEFADEVQFGDSEGVTRTLSIGDTGATTVRDKNLRICNAGKEEIRIFQKRGVEHLNKVEQREYKNLRVSVKRFYTTQWRQEVMR